MTNINSQINSQNQHSGYIFIFLVNNTGYFWECRDIFIFSHNKYSKVLCLWWNKSLCCVNTCYWDNYNHVNYRIYILPNWSLSVCTYPSFRAWSARTELCLIIISSSWFVLKFFRSTTSKSLLCPRYHMRYFTSYILYMVRV